ncbi:MAG: HDOD domain-containing protein, partial [Phycisphaeraceae bacterium]|nr:HDOD domain-containing protein [Phycisphaeraceae bacterium]
MDPRSDERATAPDPALARRVDLVLRQLTALPTLSPIATRLMSLSSAADADFNEIAALIEADPSLTARLLSLCRRASVGMAQQVTTVKRAAVMLGLEAVQAAVLSVEIYEVLSQATGSDERRADVAEGQGFDRAGFWTHSLAVAGASEMLAEGARHLKLRPEEAFTAGLVHDLGMLLLDWTLPRTYARVIELARSKRLAVAPVERAVIGVDHHLAAKRLAEHWSLPTVLRDTMWLAGQPPESLPEVRHRPMIALVTLADAMANRMHLGWGGRWCVPEALEPLAAFVKIDMEVVEQVMARLPDAVSRRSRDLGLGESAPPEVVMRALAGANRHLADLHAQCRSQAVTARAQGRALEAIASFGAGARGVASVSEALGACFASARAVGGAGFVGAVVQA